MKIQHLKRNKLYFDNGVEVKVDKMIILSFGLTEGKEISETEYIEIIYEIAKNKAYSLLARSSKGKEELRRTLTQKFPCKEAVAKVIENLEENRYLDDYDYISSFVYSKKYGKARVLYELGMKGISRDLIEEFYNKEEINEKEFIERYISKVKGKTPEKAFNFLSRRGFSFEDINEILKSHNLGAKNEYS